MTPRCWWTLLLTLCIACVSSPTIANSYLRIDGRYYLVDAVANPVVYDTFTLLWTINAAAVADCHRPNGLPGSVGNHGIVILPTYDVLYTNADIQITFQPFVLSITTPTADVTCSGSVTGPSPPPESALFANGFE